MKFSISALISTRDSHIKPDSEAGWLIWVEGWYHGRYGKFLVIIYLSHIHIDYFLAFYIANKIFELTNGENKSVAFVQLATIFVSSLVSKRYHTMSIYTMTSESVCKIYPRCWHLNGNSFSTRRIHLTQLFCF